MPEPLPQSIASASFTIFGVEIRCHVLSDGRRIVEDQSLFDLFEVKGRPERPEKGQLDEWMKWMHGSSGES